MNGLLRRAGGWALCALLVAGGFGCTALVSSSSSGVQGNGNTTGASMSADGRLVAFTSVADNLVANDNNHVADVFVKDLQTKQVTLVSASATGAIGNQPSGYDWVGPAVISEDGRFVVFGSWATNLVASPPTSGPGIYVKNLTDGTITLVSTDSTGAVHERGETPDISADGRYVSFTSPSSTLVPGDANSTYDVFVKDVQTGATQLVSTDSAGSQLSFAAFGRISDDGSGVAFFTRDGLYLKNRATGALALVSANANSIGTHDISADGRDVAYSSQAPELVGGPTNNVLNVFVKDMDTGTVLLASSGVAGSGNDSSWGAALTPDAKFVLFSSIASNLVDGDTNGVGDAFVKDLTTGALRRASLTYQAAQGNGAALAGGSFDISATGKYVAYSSSATNLLDTTDANGATYDVFRTLMS